MFGKLRREGMGGGNNTATPPLGDHWSQRTARIL